MDKEDAAIAFGYGGGLIAAALLMHFNDSGAVFAAMLIAGVLSVAGAFVAVTWIIWKEGPDA